MTRELYEFRDLIAGGCLDVVQPDCALVVGITGLRRVAIMAREFGIAFTPPTWSHGFGVVANTHLTAGLGDRTRLVEGKSVPVRVDLGGRCIFKKTNLPTQVN